MRLLVTPTFEKAVKKLHSVEKADLDTAIQHIAHHPMDAEAKVGDLLGIYVYKFRMAKNPTLVAYRCIDNETIKLLMIGGHENFYRDLKRIKE
jgi:mRNA interferase RelE/StbE